MTTAAQRGAEDTELGRLRAALEAERREKAELLIENGALRAAVAEGEAREVATADLLHALTASPHLHGLLTRIAATAARLGEADRVAIMRVEHDHFWIETRVPPLEDSPVPSAPRPLAEFRGVTARAMRERQTVHVPDVLAAADEYADAIDGYRLRGVRTHAAVPLLRDGHTIGAITLTRTAVRPFTPPQIRLLETFAAQAVIAIENSRLFSELNDANASLTEALEQQTATAEVLQIIAGSPTDVEPALVAILDSAMLLCDATTANISELDGADLVVKVGRVRAPTGETTTEHFDRRFAPGRGESRGRAVLDTRTVHIPDIAALNAGNGYDGFDPAFVEGRLAAGTKTIVSTPLLRGGHALGVLTLGRRREHAEPFTAQQISLLESFASQAVIAIENSRLFSELQERLAEQTATSEVLRAISAAPGNLSAVLDVIAKSARRLVGADSVYIGRVVGEDMTFPAVDPLPTDQTALVSRIPLRRFHDYRGVTARAFRDARTLHVLDVLAQADEYADAMAWYRATGARTVVALPLLRDGRAIGCISVTRFEVRAFTPQQIRLLETFADQAVVAIENARLFSELRDRDERRRQELERASGIQQRLLPSSVQGWPGVLEVAVRFRPAVETSGDFYDVLPLAAARPGDLPPLQIAVGDVAGKGMSAALVTALARSALRSTAAVPTDLATPANTLRLAGRRLHADVGGSHFVACALAVVEPSGSHHAGPRLRLANAAQVPVLLVRGGRASELEPPGYRLPLGAQDVGDYKDVETDLSPGDVVVLSSDGLVEAPALPAHEVGGHLTPPGQAGELFGFTRLAASASHWSATARTADEVAAGIWQDLNSWCGDQSHHDDMTLLVLRVVDEPSR